MKSRSEEKKEIFERMERKLGDEPPLRSLPLLYKVFLVILVLGTVVGLLGVLFFR